MNGTHYRSARLSVWICRLDRVSPHQLLLCNFPAPGKNLRFRPGGLGFLDVTRAIVKERETGPADLIIGSKLNRFFSCFDCFVEATELHQGHAKGMPAIEKVRSDLNTAPVFLHRASQIADGEVAIGVIKDFFGRHLCHKSNPRMNTN